MNRQHRPATSWAGLVAAGAAMAVAVGGTRCYSPLAPMSGSWDFGQVEQASYQEPLPAPARPVEAVLPLARRPPRPSRFASPRCVGSKSFAPSRSGRWTSTAFSASHSRTTPCVRDDRQFLAPAQRRCWPTPTWRRARSTRRFKPPAPAAKRRRSRRSTCKPRPARSGGRTP